jgi:hypothetical protein
MDLLETLMALDERLAGGGPDEYRELLIDDALLVVPDMVLSKELTIEAMGDSPGWDDLRLSEGRLTRLSPSSAVVTYRFDGRRGESAYSAIMSSAYIEREGAWKLAFHQQTPVTCPSATT